MLENEFERKVQQKMEEFRLRPSDAVWGNVANELQRKKKRRVVFFVFLLAGLCLLGYSGYFLFYQSKQNLVEQKATPSQTEKAGQNYSITLPAVKEGNKQIPGDNDQSANKNKTEKETESEKANVLNNSKKTAPAITNNEKQDKIKTETFTDKMAQAKNKTPQDLKAPLIKDNKKIRQPMLSKNETRSRDDAERPGDIIKENVAVKRAGEKDNERAVLPAENLKEETPVFKNESIQKKDMAVNPSDKRDIARVDIPVKDLKKETQALKLDDSTIKADLLKMVIAEKEATKGLITAKTKKGSKINWGLDFSAGVSGNLKDPFLFSGSQKSFDAFYSPLPITPGNAAYFPPMAPSSVKPGFAFKVGPAGELELSKRSKVSFGIQWAYMSSRMKIGSYSDTSLVINNPASQYMRVNAVYRGIYQQNYTNRYHFIQLPVTYQLQLNKGKKLPIAWTVGVSAGYLAATNGLLYDTSAGGIYYRDKQAFDKLQFNIHTGFAFRFGNNQRMQWSVGPEVSFATNKLVKDPYSGKQYLLYGGLTGRFIFSKKK